MDGRFPNAVLLAFVNCLDPSRIDEFDKFCDEVHLPDLQQSGMLTNAQRFVNADLQPGQPQYLNVYETDFDVAEARTAFAELRASLLAAGRMDAMKGMAESVAWGIFPSIGSKSTATAGKPVRGLLVNSQDCKDPANEAEFSDWYSNVHIPDIFASGFFHSAYRYESEPGTVFAMADPVAGVLGKYTNIYETDLDPIDASNGIRGERAKWEDTGHTNDMGEIKLRALFRPVYPKA
jgi:hypothetical protein